MKKTLTMTAIAAVTSTLLLNSGVVFASERPYVGVSYDFFKLDQDDGIGEFDTPAMTMKLGTKITPNFGVEGVLGYGVDKDSQRVNSTNVKAEIQDFYGLYATGFYPVSNMFEVTGKLGLAQVSTKLGSNSESDSSLSWGVGVRAYTQSNVSLNLDYVNLYQDSNTDVKGFSVGANYHF